MDLKNASPSQLAWSKLRQNPGGMAGLVLILLFSLMAVFCYFIVPDPSPFSNRMCLPAALQKPGSQVTFLRIPLRRDSESGIIDRLLNGRPEEYDYLPVRSVQINDQYCLAEQFSPQSSAPGLIRQIPLDRFSPVDNQAGFKAANLIQHRYWLGSDRFGRDMLSRIIVGTRVSLSVGLIAVAISLLVGISLGAIGGYFRGRVDAVVLWLINVVWSVPTLLLVVAITLALGKGFTQVFIAVGLTMWVEVARLVRGQFFSLREQQFVEAGRALGYGDLRIIARHILPNLIGPVIVVAASNFASAILLEAGLSFLGMGAQAPVPSWGMMIKENYGYIVMDYAYLAIWPGLAIAVMVLSFTLLGNALRDAFDARAMGTP